MLMKSLTLSELGNLIRSDASYGGRFHDPPDQWKGYFQSPVNKAAWTVDKSFVFNENGALVVDDLTQAITALQKWLSLSSDDPDSLPLKEWLESGTPGNGLILRKMGRRLSKESLKNSILYNQKICRLVRRDQLLYDPNYHVIYQATPGQARLLDSAPPDKDSTLEEVRLNKRNQKLYWGLSELSQSLIAMFDSDLGRPLDEKKAQEQKIRLGNLGFQLGPNDSVTKEFIRIEEVEHDRTGTFQTPYELNRYSPLRFWSPPPAFTKCVFHMLFWEPMITGYDLFNRLVPGATAVERSGYYFVIVNRFIAEKYRITDYASLLSGLSEITYALSGVNVDAELGKLDSKALSSDLFYPTFFRDTDIEFPYIQPLSLSLCFKDASPSSATVWELAHSYQIQEGYYGPTRASHLLKFIRDKILELILWSKYQMEIRSVGMVPVQGLYRIKITGKGEEGINELERIFKSSGNADESKKQINTKLFEEITSKDINDWIELVEVYGGDFRDVIDKNILYEIEWLKSHTTP